MKPTSQIIIFVLAIVTSMASAQAQSPREQLSQMVEQLQKTPTDNTLREKIIKLAQGVKPAPAIPDKAIEYEGRAQFAFKSAKSEADFIAAAREYENAIAAAPWVSGYYSDLCTIYEKAGRFENAKRNCEFYLVGLTDSAQMMDAKRRIGGLKFAIEQVTKQATAVADAAARVRQIENQKSAWAQDVVSWLKRNYDKPLKSFQSCSAPNPGPCNDAEAAGSNWYTGSMAGKKHSFAIGLTGCGKDEISIYYSFGDGFALRFCGAVGGPNISDVEWSAPRGPVEMKFRTGVIEWVRDCQPGRRCDRGNWIF